MRGLAVEPVEMRRVHGIFHGLKPVAMIDLVLLDPALAVLPYEHVPAGQQRPRLGPEIGPQEAAEFFHGIGHVLDLVLETGRFRLGRLLDTLPGTIELPAVIGTANAFLVDATESERSAAVRALLADHTITAGTIAEDDQIFAEQPNSFDRLFVGQFTGAGHRHPVTTQQLTARRAASDSGQGLVLFACEHLKLLELADPAYSLSSLNRKL